MLPTSLSFFVYLRPHARRLRIAVIRLFFAGVRDAQLVRRRSFYPSVAHRCAHPKYVILLPFHGPCRYLARRQRTYMACLNRVRPALMTYAFLSPIAKACGYYSSPCILVAADIIKGVI